MACMRYRSLRTTTGAALGLALLAGCGVARQLTTQHRTYSYTINLPPSPANVTMKGQFTVDEAVKNTYSKYHGGVDWTRLAYHAHNGSAVQPATMKLYVSLAGDLTASQLDQQATLVETMTLPPGGDQTVALDQAPKNDALRAFLATVLSQRDVSTLYFYMATTSGDPSAIMSVQNFTAQVEVHGSYF